MKLVSLNVGLPHQVKFRGKLVTTAIFKMVAVQHRVKLKRLNFEGDRQADLKVHGGIDKAVYSYPIEHYGYWKEELKDMTLSWGMYGENFTTEGLFENTVNIGNHFRVCSAIIVATQPRMPWYKHGVKFGRTSIIKKFLAKWSNRDLSQSTAGRRGSCRRQN